MPQMTLIYDGDCGFCMQWVERLRKRDVNQAIEFLSFQSEERKKRYPQIEYDEFQKGGYLFFPDQTFYRGSDAAPHLLKALPSWKWMSYFFKIPLVPFFARVIYGWIARNRHQLSKQGCKLND
jgi:predicted DCC family thiol-disulfide oxidoreductase YuxK